MSNTRPDLLRFSVIGIFWEHYKDSSNQSLHQEAESEQCLKNPESQRGLDWPIHILHLLPTVAHDADFDGVVEIEQNQMGPDHGHVVVDMAWEHVWNLVDFDYRNCHHDCANHAYHQVQGEYPHEVLKQRVQFWNVRVKTNAAEHEVTNADK